MNQNKCPNCGAVEITWDFDHQKLRCEYCQHEFAPFTLHESETKTEHLHGEVIAAGAQDIRDINDDVLTIECQSCGAEVVLGADEAVHARCHWCRSALHIDQRIANGAIPDVMLPFRITKDQAKAEIERYVKKRNIFAHPKFKKEFTADNVFGVYLPYMIVDLNAHAHLKGQGEHTTRKYGRSNKKEDLRYDAELYDLEREFDLEINGLTVEASEEKLNRTDTSHIINAIMPFDVENCVKWNANYLKGFASEKRDTNIGQLKSWVQVQAKDIARHAAIETISDYDRGVKWTDETIAIKGQHWKAACLPVWLYSYQQVKLNQDHQ